MKTVLSFMARDFSAIRLIAFDDIVNGGVSMIESCFWRLDCNDDAKIMIFRENHKNFLCYSLQSSPLNNF